MRQPPEFDRTREPHVALTHIFCGEIKQTLEAENKVSYKATGFHIIPKYLRVGYTPQNKTLPFVKIVNLQRKRVRYGGANRLAHSSGIEIWNGREYVPRKVMTYDFFPLTLTNTQVINFIRGAYIYCRQSMSRILTQSELIVAAKVNIMGITETFNFKMQIEPGTARTPTVIASAYVFDGTAECVNYNCEDINDVLCGIIDNYGTTVSWRARVNGGLSRGRGRGRERL